MRASYLTEIGGPLQFGELPDPTPADGEVVVDVTHASVNPLDIWITRGAPGNAAANLPWIPGNEGAGIVDGRPVLIRGGGVGVIRQGLFATKAAVPESALVELRDDHDPAIAAALGVAGLTAWNCVHTLGRSGPDDRVLVLGASGGVGSLAVQFAVASGARVWGQTTNAAKADGVTAAGAEHLVVTEADGLASATREFAPTLVIDGLGGTFTPAAVDALEIRGRLVLFGASAGDDIPLSSRGFYRKGLTLYGYTGLIETPESQAALLARLLDQAARGEISVPIELLPLSAAQTAFDRILARQVTGKLVLDTTA